MSRSAVELPLVADRAEALPLSTQIVGQLREAMADGRLAAGERLPSTRVLATMLGVSRTVATAAYAQLFAEGWTEGRHGSGTYVAEGAPGSSGARPPPGRRAAASARGGFPPGPVAGGMPGGAPGSVADGMPDGVPVPVAGGPAGSVASVAGEHAGLTPAAPEGSPNGAAPGSPQAAPLIELRPGIPWVPGIDRAAWRRAWRSAGAEGPATHAEPSGLPELRSALTGYLRRSRGVRCTPAEILVTRGVAGSLGLIAAGLLRRGDLVGVEEPGYPAARAVFGAHGARVVPCRVDAGGLVVDELPAGLKMIYTTPAHQYPLGGRLPVPRRQALVGWAHAHGALILEDDYDGEFRYDVAPLPALYGLDPSAVIYLGTTTKTLTQTLRVGWLVAGEALVSRLAETAARLGDWAAEPAQRAVLTLVRTGDLERHIRRMRHEYARRRAVLAAAFGDGSAGRMLGDEAGMHMVLQTHQDPRAVATAARERGVAVSTLERYYSGPPVTNGLLLGYGGCPIADVARACEVLTDILRLPDPAPAAGSRLQR